MDQMEMDRFAAMERRVLDSLRQRTHGMGNEPADLLVQPGGGGGGGDPVYAVRVTGFATDFSYFKCKAMDAAGVATGEEFNVYAFSRTDANVNIGLIDLRGCLPQYAVGEQLWVQMREAYFRLAGATGATKQRALFAVDTFMVTCAQ